MYVRTLSPEVTPGALVALEPARSAWGELPTAATISDTVLGGAIGRDKAGRCYDQILRAVIAFVLAAACICRAAELAASLLRGYRVAIHCSLARRERQAAYRASRASQRVTRQCSSVMPERIRAGAVPAIVTAPFGEPFFFVEASAASNRQNPNALLA